MQTVFVAFDSGDEHYARILKTHLETWFSSHASFVFSADFMYGEQWRERLREALQAGHLLLAICSPRSIQNRWIHFEAGAYFGRNKKVVPVLVGSISAADLPEPLNSFQAAHLEHDDQCERFVSELASQLRARVPRNRRVLARNLRSSPEIGAPLQVLPRLLEYATSKGLVPNAKAQLVGDQSPAPFRLCVDDLLLFYAATGWTGHAENDVQCTVDGRVNLPAALRQIADEYRESRKDKAHNKLKLALLDYSPYLSDREKLRLSLGEFKYFDFDGPRRRIWSGDVPTSVGNEYYLGRRIPSEIPTPLVCAHTVLLTRGSTHLVLGLRRKDVASDYPYGEHLSMGLEEQMTPDDGDVFRTVIRGLQEETGLAPASIGEITLLGMGLEASFFSIAVLLVAQLKCTPEELHESVQTRARDHEWDPIFLANDSATLAMHLSRPLPRWDDLRAEHYLAFQPKEEYQWHGTSRMRLLSYLLKKEGAERLFRL